MLLIMIKTFKSPGLFIVCLFLGLSYSSVAQLKQNVEQGDPLFLKRYTTEYQKEVKKGTFLKVYQYDDSRLGDRRKSKASGLNKINSTFTGKIMYKGYFHEVSGDSLVLINGGELIYVSINEIVLIKQYFSPFLRVAGSLVNAVGLYGLTVGSALAISGGALIVQDEGFGILFFFAGLVVGGGGYAVHRLGLLIRRNKYDLTEEWYIESMSSSDG